MACFKTTLLSAEVLYSYIMQGTMTFDGVTIFTSNSACEDGGAVYDAIIELSGVVNFTFNTAHNGGGIYLRRESLLILASQTDLTFFFNTALYYGGGIYHVDNSDPIQCSFNAYTLDLDLPQCFIQFKDLSSLYFTHKHLIYSYYDSAGFDGSFLYGGLLDRCQKGVDKILLIELISGIFNIIPKSNERQAITSQPYGLCLHHGPTHTPDCTGSRSVVIHRGQKFNVSLLAIAQGNSVTSTSVTAITSPTASLKLLQSPQHLPQYGHLIYNLFSINEEEEMVLYPEGPCHDTGNARVIINLTLLPCPDGFILASDGHCVCVKRYYMSIM